MTYRLMSRMNLESDHIDGERIWRSWCVTCGHLEVFDTKDAAIDWMDAHYCPEADDE